MKFTDLPIAKQLLIGTTAPLTLFLGIGWLSMSALFQVAEEDKMVDHTYQVLTQASKAEKLLVDLETGERGFIVTGDRGFLAPYQKARAEIDETLANLERLVVDNPPQVERVTRVREAKEKWLSEVVDKIIDIRSKVPQGAEEGKTLEQLLGNSIGKSMMDEIRSDLQRIDQSFTGKGLDRGRLLTAQVLNSVLDMESGQRGFLVTGKEDFLDTYFSGQRTLGPKLTTLASYTQKKLGNSGQARVEHVADLVHHWIKKASEPEIAERRRVIDHQGALRQIGNMVSAKLGKNLMDEMREQLDHFKEVEQRLLMLRNDAAKADRAQVLWIIGLGIAFSIGLAFTATLLVVRKINHGLLKIANQSQLIGRGLIPDELRLTQTDEVGIVAANLDKLASGLRQKLKVAGKLAEGNIEQEVVLLSDQDEMGQAMVELVRRLRVKAELVAQVAKGDLSAEITLASYQDHLGRSLRLMLDSLKEKEQLIGQVVQGNLPDQQTQFSDVDILGQSLSRMVATLRDIAKQADQISEGDYATTITPRSDQDRLGLALSRMTGALKHNEETSALQDWLKNGQNLLTLEIRGEFDGAKLAKKSISFLATYLKAQMGGFYGLDEQGEHLVLMGSFGFSKRKALNERFKIGEGLVGQAALEKTMISVTEVPEDYMRISSAAGESLPRNVVLVPLLFNEQLAGVIELASFEIMNDTAMELLLSAADSVAIGLNAARAQTQMAALLDETQRQSEEMQRQQEELEISNKELSKRTHDMERQKEGVEKQNVVIEEARARLEVQTTELALSSKYKSEFMANMSHELRTPLNSILLLSQTLAESPKHKNLNDKQRQSVSTIYNSGFYLLSLINEILDLSKIEAGKLDLKPDDFALAEFTEELLADFTHVAAEKELQFEVKANSDCPAEINVDRLRLTQVIKNLLSNAFKFTDKGGVTVSFTGVTSKELEVMGESTNQWIAVRVNDSGIGIPDEQQSTSFEAFKQLDGGLSRRYDGTGLGLSISRELAHLMGGKIFLESKVGVGSTFTLVLPLVSPVTGGHGDQQTTESYVLPTPAPLVPSLPKSRKPMVLVIEDDPHFAQILDDRCEEMDFSCQIVGNGKEGLELANSLQPTGIILDVKLPDMDGLEVLGRLRENENTRNIPVHVISAYELEENPVAKGAVDFLTKPVSKGQLEAMLENISGHRGDQVARVLLVEDDKVLRETLAELLSDSGRHVKAVAQGKTALKAAENQGFDCVILDLTLKDMDGLEVLEKLGEVSPGLPVVIYTGRDLTKEDQQRLNQFTDAIVIKSDHSVERLMDEVDLFINRLPLPASEATKPMAAADMVPLAGKKLLLVDDDMRNLFALCQVLEDHGLEVVLAGDGAKALEILEEDLSIDLVFMDIMMPNMDGLEAIGKIRGQLGLKKLPIVALTAKAMAEDKEECLAAGATDYMTKPVDVNRMLSLVKLRLEV